LRHCFKGSHFRGRY